MLFPTVITTLSAFAALTSATLSFTTRVSTSTVLECGTIFGKKSLSTPVPTVIRTTTVRGLGFVGTSTFTPTQTITPPPKTSSTTITLENVLTTTNTAITDFFSTTSTVYETKTSTVFTTSTATSTSSFTEFVSETVTQTVATSPGFLPAASTTPEAYPNPNPVRSLRKRVRSQEEGATSPNDKRTLDGWSSAKFPQSVKCVKTLKVLTTTIIIITARTTTTTTLVPVTNTISVTTTTTSVSTVVPAAVTLTSSFSTTSTISESTTQAVLESITVSATESVTVTTTSSIYAACATDSGNLLGPAVPGGFISFPAGQPTDFLFTSAPTAYDCCVSCLLSTTCAGSYARVGATRCILFKADQCAAQGLSHGAYALSPTSGFQTFVVSNSNCGYLSQQ